MKPIETQTEPREALCNSQLRKGWYRFVGAAGTRMPTERVQAFRCGTNWPAWLTTTHPAMEDGEIRGMVCFSDRSTGCQYSKKIFVKKMWILLHLQFFFSHQIVIRAIVVQTECGAKKFKK